MLTLLSCRGSKLELQLRSISHKCYSFFSTTMPSGVPVNEDAANWTNNARRPSLAPSVSAAIARCRPPMVGDIGSMSPRSRPP